MKQLAVILLFMACFVDSRASGALADDSLYCFRFVRGKGMFYVPYKGNEQALERLMVLIGMHREDILSGNIPVFVEGFCPDRKTARERNDTAGRFARSMLPHRQPCAGRRLCGSASEASHRAAGFGAGG